MSEQAYDGFISYSHAADGLLAPRLQAGLQRFAKPWWKRRAVRIFRDESSLSANPHLWSSITEALDSSGWFVLLLSPDAASSEWVGQEIAYWAEHRDPRRILPVVTDGTFEWSEGDVTGSAVPDALRGVFSEEPRWVDVRWARGEEQLDLSDPRFADAVADIGSAIRGVPKDELASEEVRQHRRTVRTAWAAGGLVAVLAIAAVGFGVQSARNADEAQRLASAEASARAEAVSNAEEAAAQTRLAEENAAAEALARAEAEEQRRAAVDAANLARSRELGAGAVEALEADGDPKLAALLSLESLFLAGSLDEQPVTLVDTLFRSVLEDRLVREVETGVFGLHFLALSPDESTLVVSAARGDRVVAYSVPRMEERWVHEEETADTLAYVWYRPDGEVVAVGIWDSEAYDRKARDPDDQPARILFLDARTGEEIDRLEFPDCGLTETWGWSPDGSVFVVTSGGEECPHPSGDDGWWVDLLDGTTLESRRVWFSPRPDWIRPEFTETGDLYLLTFFHQDSRVLRAPDYDEEGVVPLAGFGDVSPDGRYGLGFSVGNAERLTLVDLQIGERVDILRPLEGNPSLPMGLTFSPDGTQAIAQTEYEGTIVWEVASGRREYVLPSGPAGMARMTSDGSTLYTSHSDGAIRVWDLRPVAVGQRVVGDLEGFNWVNGNSFGLSDTVGAAQVIKFGDPVQSRLLFFDPSTGEIQSILEDEALRATPLAGDRFLFRRTGGKLYVYDAGSGVETYLAGCTSREEQPPFFCEDTGEAQRWVDARRSIDGTQLMVLTEKEAGSDRDDLANFDVQVLDAATLDEVEEAAIPDLAGLDDLLTFSDEWILGLEGNYSRVVSLDRESGEVLARFVDCGCQYEFSSSGRLYAAADFSGELSFVDLEDWTVRRYPLGLGQVRGMAFSPDESTLVVSGSSAMRFIDVATGELTRELPIGDASDFHWIDEETILFGNRDGLWATVTLDPERLASETLTNLTRGFTRDECERFAIEPCPDTVEAIRERYAGVGS